MRKYRNYTNEDFLNAVKESNGLAGLIKKLGLIPAGGNYSHMKKLIQELNADCSHWTGQGWNKGIMLKDWKTIQDQNISKHIL